MNAAFQINEKQIETERLLLRAFQPSDLDDFYAYASVEGVGERAGWKHHESLEESARILDDFIRHDQTFAIVLKSDHKVIGSLGVEKYGMEDKLTEFFDYQGREIGYALSKAYWGNGFMTEAVRSVITYLFKDADLDFLICGYYDFNLASKRVQEKCGFRAYRRLITETGLGTKEPTTLNLLPNPDKQIVFTFSHPETLIYHEAQTPTYDTKTNRQN